MVGWRGGRAAHLAGSSRPPGRGEPMPPTAHEGREQLTHDGTAGELLGIGAAAARAGVSERALRYYQQIGLLVRPAPHPAGCAATRRTTWPGWPASGNCRPCSASTSTRSRSCCATRTGSPRSGSLPRRADQRGGTPRTDPGMPRAGRGLRATVQASGSAGRVPRRPGHPDQQSPRAAGRPERQGRRQRLPPGTGVKHAKGWGGMVICPAWTLNTRPSIPAYAGIEGRVFSVHAGQITHPTPTLSHI